MTSALKTSKKKSKKTATAKTPAKTVVLKVPAKPASTRKEARKSTLTNPTASSRAKVVPRTAQPRPKPPLVRTEVVRSGLSTMAKEAVDRDKARRAAEAARSVPPPKPPRPTVPPRPQPSKAPPPEPVLKDDLRSQVDDPVPADDPPPLADDPAPPVTKTRRAGLVTTSGDDYSRELNRGLDRDSLAEIFGEYYAFGFRLNTPADPDLIYKLMGKGETTYLDAPVSQEEFDKFKQASPVIEAQKMWPSAAAKAEASYQRRKARYDTESEAWNQLSPDDRGDPPVEPQAPPRNLDQALDRGDYFHVHNTNSMRPAEQDVTRRARRIIVNVNSQQAGLKVSENLSRLFGDSDVSPYLDHYKIYLSRNPDADTSAVKHDKLVVYYETDPDATDDFDEVGDRIADTVKNSVGQDEVSDDFAPFYARLGHGMAWAEEPKAFVAELGESFTRTRAKIIEQALDSDAADDVEDVDGFVNLIRNALADNLVDPDNPHRHLPGGEPEQGKVRKRKTPPLSTLPKVVATPTPLLVAPRRLIEPLPATLPKPAAKIATTIPRKPLPPLPAQRIVTTGSGGPAPITQNRID